MPVLPREVWSYWHEGIEGEFNKLCRQSWKLHLPNWKINVVRGKDELFGLVPSDYLPVDFDKLTVHKKADSARIALLRRYGGIWMDMSILLTDNYDWVEKLVNEEGHTFVCYAMYGHGKFGMDGKRGDEVIENWWFATISESPVIKAWNETWVRWLNDDYRISDVKEFQDEPWFKDGDSGKQMKHYLASEVALKFARNRVSSSKKEFDHGRVWIGNAQDDPFWFNQMTGWDSFKFDSLSYAKWVAYEKNTLGHPIRFCKFTGGAKKTKEGALNPSVLFKKGTAAHRLFSIHGYGVKDIDALCASQNKKSVGSSVSMDVSPIVIALLCLLTVFLGFCMYMDWRAYSSFLDRSKRGRKWPLYLSIMLLVNIFIILISVSSPSNQTIQKGSSLKGFHDSLSMGIPHTSYIRMDADLEYGDESYEEVLKDICVPSYSLWVEGFKQGVRMYRSGITSTVYVATDDITETNMTELIRKQDNTNKLRVSGLYDEIPSWIDIVCIDMSRLSSSTVSSHTRVLVLTNVIESSPVWSRCLNIMNTAHFEVQSRPNTGGIRVFTRKKERM